MGERPFKILGVQQIALGAPDKSALKRLWVDLFGLAVTGTYRSEKENVDEDILVAGSGAGAVEIDLMQPIDPEKSPKVHVPPLNHIGLWVDDLPAAVAWLGEQGVRFAPGGIRKGAAGHDVCFVHPKGSAELPVGGEGVLIELVQAPKSASLGLVGGGNHAIIRSARNERGGLDASHDWLFALGVGNFDLHGVGLQRRR